MNTKAVTALTVAGMLALGGLTYGAAKPRKPKPKPKPPAVTVESFTRAVDSELVKPIKPAGIHTWKEFQDSLLSFHRRTLIEAYRKVGAHDPKWDDKAVAFMENYIRLSVQLPDAPSPTDLGKQAHELVDLGCTDPLVVSLCGIAFFTNHEDSAAAPLLDRSLTDLQTSKYSAWRVAVVVHNLLILRRTTEIRVGDQNRNLLSIQCASWVKSFGDGSFLPGEERVMLYNFRRIFDKYDRPDAVREMKKSPGVSKYLMDILEAEDEIKAAWDARGPGWASQVTEKGWKGMSDHFAVARTLLTEAWKLHPEDPEAPSMMIEVAMADSSPKNGSPRTWFDRAVAAELDYEPAYTAYRRFLLPRWGGSSDEMYEFGVQCLKTGRFDTETPWGFFRALWAITDDLDGDKRYWLKPQTAKYLETLYDGYAGTNPKIPQHYKSLKAVTAWYLGDDAKAKVLLDELGDKYSTDAFEVNFRVHYDLVRRQVNMRAGKFAADLARLDVLYDAGKYADALALARELAVKAADDPAVVAFLNLGIPRMEVLVAFRKGEWANLKLGSNFAGWITEGSHWTTEQDGTIVGLPQDGPGLMLRSDMDFGKEFELKGEFEFLPKKSGTRNAQIVFRHKSGLPCVGFYRDGDKVAMFDLGGRAFASIANAGVVDKNEFLVQYWDGDVTVYLNGKLMKKACPADPYVREDLSVGLSSLTAADDEKVRFRKLQIHKLVKQP